MYDFICPFKEERPTNNFQFGTKISLVLNINFVCLCSSLRLIIVNCLCVELKTYKIIKVVHC